jgi:hypothetical protein
MQSGAANMSLFRKSNPESRQWSALQAAPAVLWSFLGVQRGVSGREAAAQLTSMRVITAGIIGAALFVTTIMTIAHMVVRIADH